MNMGEVSVRIIWMGNAGAPCVASDAASLQAAAFVPAVDGPCMRGRMRVARYLAQALVMEMAQGLVKA